MISDKKLEANRRNAQKSTGPRTAEGKARSAKNATTHGLFAADNVIHTMGETDAEYTRFKDTLLDAFPTDHPIDRVLAEDFINCHWRLRRIRQMEAGYLDSMCQELLENVKLFPPAPDYNNTEAHPRAGDFRLIGNAGSLGNLYLNNLSRYESRLRAASYRALAEINAGKNEPTESGHPPSATRESKSEPIAPAASDGKNETNALSKLLNRLTPSVALPLIAMIVMLLAGAATLTAQSARRPRPAVPLARLPMHGKPVKIVPVPAKRDSIAKSPVTAERPSGRPRDPDSERRILEATLRMLAEEGYARMSLDAVVAAAGASKPTIYRRWSSKADVATAALRTLQLSEPAVNTGSTRGDLTAALENFSRSLLRPNGMSLIGTVLAEEAHTPELLRLFRERIVAPRRAMLREILVRARDRGELRHGVDLDAAVTMLVGAFYARYLAGPQVPAAFARDLVEIVWTGIARQARRPTTPS